MSTDWSNFFPMSATRGMPTAYTSSSDYSPTSDGFSYPDTLDRPYIADAFSNQPPDFALDDWVLADYYDQPAAGMELHKQGQARFPRKDGRAFDASLGLTAPGMDAWRSAELAPLDGSALQKTAFTNALPFSMARANSYDSNFQVSPRDASSPTPSLCGDGFQLDLGADPASPASSHSTHSTDSRKLSLKRESPCSPAPAAADEPPAEPAPKRKRGRPRLNHPDASYNADSGSAKPRPSRRLPHNQVERKYREGLNSELERLRRAIPTLPQTREDDPASTPKPSKATVLASAIEYIKYIEADRERLLAENDRLRGVPASTSTRTGSSSNNKLRGGIPSTCG